ncbi:uncharacterized protein LOC131037501 [Cryptomeria japonica]|uniref:uncharacterized protein LOC131037501 n=1 Tax=Cryptomeria japonica TaxID=3369 RepID=UPI0027D9DFEB|nr:uncharacterized protein LOC131037501 [Cryptomeria japonica]
MEPVWFPPLPGCYKLNFDGVARQGLAAGGGVIRTHNGALVAAYDGNLNGHTSNQAEAMALAWGIEFSLSMGIRCMYIEGDSKLIIDVVKGQNRLNWTIEGPIRDTLRLISRLESFRIMHVFRGNGVVDALFALGLTNIGLRCWRSHTSLPPHVNFLLMEERIQTQIDDKALV